MVMQRTANPPSSVRFRSRPPLINVKVLCKILVDCYALFGNLVMNRLAFHFTLLIFFFLSILNLCYCQDFLKFTNPLVGAADNDDLEKVKILLERGIDPNMRGRFGVTALMRASFNGNKEMAKLLLEYGADPALQDVGGVNSLKMAKRSNHLKLIGLFDLKHELSPYPSGASYEPLLLASESGKLKSLHHIANKIDDAKIDEKSYKFDADENIANKISYSEYTTQLYEDFYSLDYTANSKSYEHLKRGVYKVSLASDAVRIAEKNDKNFIKLTEAVELADTYDTNLQSKRDYVIIGFTDRADMDSKMSAKLINFYFKSKDFEKDYDQLIVQLSNNFSLHQGKKACARLMRRFRILRCEIY